MSNPSPFLPNSQIQWAWDSTSLGWFKECPYKYYLHMIEGWRAKGESAHLDFGIFYHQALENYDRRLVEGMSHDDAVIDSVTLAMNLTWINDKPWRLSKTLDTGDSASLKCRENLIRSIVWYLDKFKNDTAKTQVFEGVPLIERHFQLDIGKGYTLCGYLDRVVDFQELPFVMDRKTTAQTLSDYYWSRFDPDNQMSFYTFAAQIIFKNPIKGVIVDACQVAVGFSRFGRRIISKSPDQIEEWIGDTFDWFDRAKGYAERGRWPMNDKSCMFCAFKKVCNKSPSVRRSFLESNYERSVWNPLIPR